MNGRSFLDTNIVIYAHTDLDSGKKRITQQLITSQTDIFISTQVLQELINILSKKFRLSWTDVALLSNKLSPTIVLPLMHLPQ